MGLSNLLFGSAISIIQLFILGGSFHWQAFSTALGV